MDRRIILHIGAHKTGSSSIQKILYLNNEVLNEKNWHLININDKPNNTDLVWFNEECFYINRGVLFSLEEEIKNTDKNIILSCEDLFFLSENREIYVLSQLIKKHFDKVHLICYLRRQVEMAISQKKQGAKSTQSGYIFGHDDDILPKLTSKVIDYLEYSPKIKCWIKNLNPNKVSIINFHRDSLIERDAIKDFIYQTKLDITIFYHIHENESLSHLDALFLHKLHMKKLPKSYLWKLVVNDILNSKTDLRSSQPSRTRVINYMKNFHFDNLEIEKLASKSPFFSNNYDQYNEEIEVKLDRKYERKRLLMLLKNSSLLYYIICAFFVYDIEKIYDVLFKLESGKEEK